MILHFNVNISGKQFKKGNFINPWAIYAFFLVHMFAFGVSGFVLAYFVDLPVYFLYMHGGIAILAYLIFYLVIFGLDDVKWMFINAGLGILGIYSEVKLILFATGKDITDYPYYVHVVPFLYYVFYTFLLRQVVLEVAGVGDDKQKAEKVSYVYMVISLVVYGGLYLYGKFV